MPIFKREVKENIIEVESVNTPNPVPVPHLNLILDWKKDEVEEIPVKILESVSQN